VTVACIPGVLSNAMGAMGQIGEKAQMLQRLAAIGA